MTRLRRSRRATHRERSRHSVTLTIHCDRGECQNGVTTGTVLVPVPVLSKGRVAGIVTRGICFSSSTRAPKLEDGTSFPRR